MEATYKTYQTCDKHIETPVKGYRECVGCEVEALRSEIEALKTAATIEQLMSDDFEVDDDLHNQSNFLGLEDDLKNPKHIYHRVTRKYVGVYDSAENAQNAAKWLERSFRFYEEIGDRAGQHHILSVILFNKNKARWTGKAEIAAVYAEVLMRLG